MPHFDDNRDIKANEAFAKLYEEADELLKEHQKSSECTGAGCEICKRLIEERDANSPCLP